MMPQRRPLLPFPVLVSKQPRSSQGKSSAWDLFLWLERGMGSLHVNRFASLKKPRDRTSNTASPGASNLTETPWAQHDYSSDQIGIATGFAGVARQTRGPGERPRQHWSGKDLRTCTSLPNPEFALNSLWVADVGLTWEIDAELLDCRWAWGVGEGLILQPHKRPQPSEELECQPPDQGSGSSAATGVLGGGLPSARRPKPLGLNPTSGNPKSPDKLN
ncbi:hypothetical protein B0I37DRAFT_403284 [Chaetomium sp. MPI-CAGE-AT-0009]|nr:hypothetical protein B0I37DRAFT_403284 [Chaetomium sp. MPI-CAGE-AT-0009]